MVTHSNLNGNRLAAYCNGEEPEIRILDGHISEMGYDDRHVRNIRENFPVTLLVPHPGNCRLVVDLVVTLGAVRDVLRADAIGVRLRRPHVDRLANVSLTIDLTEQLFAERVGLLTV